MERIPNPMKLLSQIGGQRLAVLHLAQLQVIYGTLNDIKLVKLSDCGLHLLIVKVLLLSWISLKFSVTLK